MPESLLSPPARDRVSDLSRRVIGKAKTIIGYDRRNWLRVRQIEAFAAFLEDDQRTRKPVLEVSPGWNTRWKEICANYTSVDYPEFDICADVLPETFDIVIADQVLEHVRHPVAAARNIHSMVTPGGWAMVATPFLFRVHARPHDYNRWTAEGLKQLLVDGGFAEADVASFAWGNKPCARAHIGGPVRSYGLWRNMSNDDEYPMMVWAFAQKSGGG
jgi:SAM-dependent methyltransferase